MDIKELNIDQETPHILIAEAPEPSAFRLISTLGVAGFFSGLILVLVYIYATPVIEANKAEALQKAIFKVLPACQTFETLELRDGQLIEPKEGTTNKEALLIFAGYNPEGKLIGFAIPGNEAGFQDIIGALIGYNMEQKVIIGFEVLESKETPGLGDKIFKDDRFKLNFKALAIEPEIVPVKPGNKKNANEVETITGATISSKAVVRLLNNTMGEYKKAIEEYMNKKNE